MKVKLAFITEPRMSARVTQILTPRPNLYQQKYFTALEPAITSINGTPLPPTVVPLPNNNYGA
jgi:hypothetical protein